MTTTGAPTRARHSWVVAIAALAILIGSQISPGATAAEKAPMPSADALPAPYASWNVTLQPHRDNPRALTLTFDSPLLERRVTNTVYLPPSYRVGGQKMPVMYALHGTVIPQTDNCLLKPVEDLEAFVQMTGCGGGHVQNGLNKIESQLDKMRFLVVAPDTDPEGSWCQTCVWVDGRKDLLPNIKPLTAETVPADSFLHTELYPLVETLFHTRTDRGGRGVFGFSMGGWGALLQGFMHPDRYAYVSSMSGVYSAVAEPELTSYFLALGYLRDQGYGDPITQRSWWEQFSPGNIATNVRGVDTDILLSAGTVCLNLPSDLRAEDCRGRFSVVRAPGSVWAENVLLKQWKLAKRDLAEKGIEAQYVQHPGIHGSNNHRIYADYIVAGANTTFARDVQQRPAKFSYRSVMPRFSVWDYRVEVSRHNAEFLSITGARTDGRAFSLLGSGSASIVTPARFEPGHTYTVTARSSSGGEVTAKRVTATEDKRLRLSVDLGTPHTGSANGSALDVVMPSQKSTHVTIAG